MLCDTMYVFFLFIMFTLSAMFKVQKQFQHIWSSNGYNAWY